LGLFSGAYSNADEQKEAIITMLLDVGLPSPSRTNLVLARLTQFA
jgi:hypothetical protein